MYYYDDQKDIIVVGYTTYMQEIIGRKLDNNTIENIPTNIMYYVRTIHSNTNTHTYYIKKKAAPDVCNIEKTTVGSGTV